VTRALVIGGGGFVGVAACKELMRRGVETIAAGRKDRPYGTFTSYLAFDRDDESALRKALDSAEPDVVLDLAAYVPDHIDAVARSFKGARYVFVSSGAVYPELNGKRAVEDDFEPLSGSRPMEFDYPTGKRWCETALHGTGDFPWTVVRPPSVFGPADPSLRIAAYMQRVADGGPLLVPSETIDRPFGISWVKDIGFACALACDPRKQATHRIYNAAFESVSLRELIEGFARAMGVTAKLRPVPFAQITEGASPYGPDPRRYGGMDITRARTELSFEPSALEDALAETLAWFRVARPSHPGYATRPLELDIAGESGNSVADS
jgi:nucleoside-diphosphate-sugar epimerase